MDRYQTRLKEKQMFVKAIKQDIKDMLEELGYGDGVYVDFSITCKPDRFTRIGTMYSTLFFVDYELNEWHEDNINDIDELLSILRAMHHLS